MTEIQPGSRIGPFTVEKALPQGKGGMARVYVATRRASDGTLQRVALKVSRIISEEPDPMKRARLQRFYFDALQNEVAILTRLKHPGIVQLYPIPWEWEKPVDPYIARAEELPGMPWYCVMEFLAGGSLAGRIKEKGTLPVKEAVEIAHQVCLALDYLHAKGMAHLDVKADNVLFRYKIEEGQRPEAVLVDFGIARRHQKTGLGAGALPWMPPERIREVRGEVPPEEAAQWNRAPTDIYGLGILLYVMLAGRLPFGGRSTSQIASAILMEAPTEPSSFNTEIVKHPGLERAIMEALAKDPEDRPSAQEMALLLDQAVPPPRYMGRPGAVYESVPIVAKKRFPYHQALLAALALIVVVETSWIVAGPRGWLASPSPTPTPQPPTPTPVATVEPTRPPTSTPTRVPAAGPAEKPTVTPVRTEWRSLLPILIHEE